MAIRYGKIVKNELTIDSLRVMVMNNTMDELENTRQGSQLIGALSFSRLESGDLQKEVFISESFVRQPGSEHGDLQKVQGSTRFEKQSSRWVHQPTKLFIDPEHSLRLGMETLDRQTIDFVRLMTINITMDELKKLYGRRMYFVDQVVLTELESGDKNKLMFVVDTKIKQPEPRMKELLEVQSFVEFHMECELWVPRILKLKLGNCNVPIHFACNVTWNEEKYSYEVHGPIDPNKSI